MATTLPNAATATPRPDGSRAARTGVHPIVPAVGSALLLWASFPPLDWNWLAWIALVPMFLMVRGERSGWAIYPSAWVGGMVFWHLAIVWVWETDPSAWVGWVAMASFLSLWWPGFLLLARPAVRRLRLPLMVAAPVVWIALEYTRAYIMTGFPWYYLGHSQYRFLPLIQVADITGAWGVSLLVALVNAWVADLLSLPLLRPTPRGVRPARPQVVRLATVGTLLALTLGYGLVRLGTAEFREGPRVALLQSSFRQDLKMNLSSEEILSEYGRLIARAMDRPEPPALIVWPETSYPRGYPVFDPSLDERTLERQIKSIHPRATIPFWMEKLRYVETELHGWSDRYDVPMVVGATTYDFGPGGLRRFNSAILFRPGGTETASYHKLHLVPFGEYVPLLQTFPWLTRLTPYQGDFIPSMTFGAGPSWFDLDGLRLATAICFEDTVPHVVRRFFAEVPDGHQPDLLLNISNDGWFHGSSELDMHLAISVFRAVEHRVPIARAVNTGISALIDGNGRIVAELPKLKADVLVVDVPLDDRETLYTLLGDWPALACLAATIGLVPLALICRRRAA